MKSTSTLSIILLALGISAQAQVSTFIPDAGLDLAINGNYLYHISSVDPHKVLRVDISNPMLLTVLPVADTDESEYFVNQGVSCLGVSGTHLYLGTVGIILIETGRFHRIDLTDLSADAVEVSTEHAYYGNDLDFKGDVMYACDVNFSAITLLRSFDLSNPLPVASNSYSARDATALTIDGYTMYFGASVYDTGTLYDGEIYVKSMLAATPEALLYTANGVILDLLMVDGLLYFTDDDGLKRLNPLDAVPTATLIAANADYGTIRKIQHKEYSTGASCLFATETTGQRIIKIDLNAIVTSTAVQETEEQFKLYPNPTQVEVTISSNVTIQNLTVYDAMGRVVATEALNGTLNSKTLNVSDLPVGFYTIKAETANGVRVSEFLKR